MTEDCVWPVALHSPGDHGGSSTLNSGPVCRQLSVRVFGRIIFRFFTIQNFGDENRIIANPSGSSMECSALLMMLPEGEKKSEAVGL